MQLINNFFSNLFASFIPKAVIKPSEKDEVIDSKTKTFENKTYLEKRSDYLTRTLSKDKEVIRYEFNNKNIKHNDDEKLIYVNKYKGLFNDLPQTGQLNKNKYNLSFSKDIRYKLINKLTKDDELAVSDGTYNPLDFPIPEGYYRLDADPCKARTAISDTIDENKGITHRIAFITLYEWHTYKKFKKITFNKTTGIWGTPTDYNALYRVYYKQKNGQTFSNNNYHDVYYQNVLDPQYWG